MSLSLFFKILGYFTSVSLFLFGLIVLTGFPDIFNTKYMPSQFRTMFGVVFMLYGIYRFVRLRFIKNEPDKENDDDVKNP